MGLLWVHLRTAVRAGQLQGHVVQHPCSIGAAATEHADNGSSNPLPTSGPRRDSPPHSGRSARSILSVRPESHQNGLVWRRQRIDPDMEKALLGKAFQ